MNDMNDNNNDSSYISNYSYLSNMNKEEKKIFSIVFFVRFL